MKILSRAALIGSALALFLSFTPFASAASAPTITSVSPATGMIGDTIAVTGKNFDSQSYLLIDGLNGGLETSLDAATTTLGFVIPATIRPICNLFGTSNQCSNSITNLAAGVHKISILTKNGTSASVSFTVTSSTANGTGSTTIDSNGYIRDANSNIIGVVPGSPAATLAGAGAGTAGTYTDSQGNIIDKATGRIIGSTIGSAAQQQQAAQSSQQQQGGIADIIGGLLKSLTGSLGGLLGGGNNGGANKTGSTQTIQKNVPQTTTTSSGQQITLPDGTLAPKGSVKDANGNVTFPNGTVVDSQGYMTNKAGQIKDPQGNVYANYDDMMKGITISDSAKNKNGVADDQGYKTDPKTGQITDPQGNIYANESDLMNGITISDKNVLQQAQVNIDEITKASGGDLNGYTYSTVGPNGNQLNVYAPDGSLAKDSNGNLLQPIPKTPDVVSKLEQAGIYSDSGQGQYSAPSTSTPVPNLVNTKPAVSTPAEAYNPDAGYTNPNDTTLGNDNASNPVSSNPVPSSSTSGVVMSALDVRTINKSLFNGELVNQYTTEYSPGTNSLIGEPTYTVDTSGNVFVKQPESKNPVPVIFQQNRGFYTLKASLDNDGNTVVEKIPYNPAKGSDVIPASEDGYNIQGGVYGQTYSELTNPNNLPDTGLASGGVFSPATYGLPSASDLFAPQTPLVYSPATTNSLSSSDMFGGYGLSTGGYVDSAANSVFNWTSGANSSSLNDALSSGYFDINTPDYLAGSGMDYGSSFGSGNFGGGTSLDLSGASVFKAPTSGYDSSGNYSQDLFGNTSTSGFDTGFQDQNGVTDYTQEANVNSNTNTDQTVVCDDFGNCQ